MSDRTPALVQHLRGSWALNPAPGTRISRESERPGGPGGGPSVTWSLYCSASPGQCCRASTHWPSKLLTASRMQGRGRDGGTQPDSLSCLGSAASWPGLGHWDQWPKCPSFSCWHQSLPGPVLFIQVDRVREPQHTRSWPAAARVSEGGTLRSRGKAARRFPTYPQEGPPTPLASHAGWAPGKTMVVLSCSRGSSHSMGCSLFLEKARK